MTLHLSTFRRIGTFTVALVALTVVTTSSQTTITPPETRYSLAEDVKLGQEAAAEARKELPMFRDARVEDYIDRVGARLVAGIPPEFQHTEFQYTFDIINQKEINAFALPGGPMFLNRGMIEAANSEAEMAGVMAHEISHVALRHGTANATKAAKPAALSILGQIVGAVVGGTWGSIIGTGSQLGTAAWAMKYSREYESQADILGAQMLARAGYDPREMANMFKTIEAQGGSSGPEWFSSHPHPGNRYEAITREASLLTSERRADTANFGEIQAHLKGAGRSYSAEEVAKGEAKGSNAPAPTARTVVKVAPPSSQMRTVTPSNALRLSVPSNWNPVRGTGATYVPEGAWFEQNGSTAFTHGVQFGVTTGSGNLQRDTQTLLQGLVRSNPSLRQQSNFRRDTLGGRQALSATLTNVSGVTGGPEVVTLTTATMPDGDVLYMIGVAPQSESRTYTRAFTRVKQSVRIATR